MLRPMLVAAAMTLLSISLCLADDHYGRVPVPGSGRSAAAGNDAQVTFAETAAGSSVAALDGLLKADRARDQVGARERLTSGKAFRLAAGTPVLVIAPHLRPLEPSTTYSGPASSFARSVGGGGFREEFLETLEVRVMDGPLKGKALFVAVDAVALMKAPDPRIVAQRLRAAKAAEKKAEANAKVKARPADPAARAAALLQMGKNLQGDGLTDAALENYRKIIAEFADTPAAKEAAVRVKSLTKK